MPANPWQLRADVRPLELAADRWEEVAQLMTGRAEELVGAALHATDGWDAAAAESYDTHRREVLVNLDHFTTLAEQMALSLRAVAGMLLDGQQQLDREWTTVALVPHDVVGDAGYVVFRPDHDEDRTLVTRAQTGADDIRARLAGGLEAESARMRATRAELVTIHTELQALDRTGFPVRLGPLDGTTGVGMLAPSTSVPGAAQSGAAAGVAGLAGLAPIAPIDVSMPHLSGIDGAPLAPLAAAAVLARGARRASSAAPPANPTFGGMGAGGVMGARGGSASRPATGGRPGARRLATPRLSDSAGDDEQARAAREKAAEKDAKRATLEEKRAERAARRAERAARRERRDDDDRDPYDASEEPEEPEEPEDDGHEGVDEEVDDDLGDGSTGGSSDPAPSAVVPGDDRGGARR